MKGKAKDQKTKKDKKKKGPQIAGAGGNGKTRKNYA